MAKRKNLADVDFAKPGGEIAVSVAVEPAKGAAASSGQVRTLKERSAQLNFYVHPDAKLQLNRLASNLSTPDHKVTANDLAVEALNLLFKRHELPQIAEPPEM